MTDPTRPHFHLLAGLPKSVSWSKLVAYRLPGQLLTSSQTADFESRLLLVGVLTIGIQLKFSPLNCFYNCGSATPTEPVCVLTQLSPSVAGLVFPPLVWGGPTTPLTTPRKCPVAGPGCWLSPVFGFLGPTSSVGTNPILAGAFGHSSGWLIG